MFQVELTRICTNVLSQLYGFSSQTIFLKLVNDHSVIPLLGITFKKLSNI